MRLSTRGMAIASALLWAVGVLFIGLVHLASPSYGASFLNGISSVYVGFHGGRSFGDVLVGTIYALIDGGVGGFLFAWVYNMFAGAASL